MIPGISFAPIALPETGTLVVFCFEDRAFSPTAQAVDERSDGALRRAVEAGRFTGGRGQSLDLVAPSGVQANRIVLVGLGKKADLDVLAAENAAGALIAQFLRSGEKALSVAVDPLDEAKVSAEAFAAHFALGASLRAYSFDRYRTKAKDDDKPSLERLTLMVGDTEEAERAFAPLRPVAEAVAFARDLVNEPANVLFPA